MPSKKQLRVAADAGHGLGNVGGKNKAGKYKYDTGATYRKGKVHEATIAMDYVNCLKAILEKRGVYVVRTRAHRDDPCPVDRRDDVAVAFKADVMVCFHTNASDDPRSNGTETFYRGEEDRVFAERLTAAVCRGLGTRPRGLRGAKTEKDSQHKTLAVMAFRRCALIELGFGTNDGELEKILDPVHMQQACENIADVILSTPF